MIGVIPNRILNTRLKEDFFFCFALSDCLAGSDLPQKDFPLIAATDKMRGDVKVSLNIISVNEQTFEAGIGKDGGRGCSVKNGPVYAEFFEMKAFKEIV